MSSLACAWAWGRQEPGDPTACCQELGVRQWLLQQGGKRHRSFSSFCGRHHPRRSLASPPARAVSPVSSCGWLSQEHTRVPHTRTWPLPPPRPGPSSQPRESASPHFISGSPRMDRTLATILLRGGQWQVVPATPWRTGWLCHAGHLYDMKALFPPKLMTADCFPHPRKGKDPISILFLLSPKIKIFVKVDCREAL